MNPKPDSIKSMKLYTHVDRVFNELRELGLDLAGPLSVEQLSPFDQLHYHGTDAIDTAIQQLQLDSGAAVLEIGSGIGGPSRYIAYKTGASVHALELQQDQSDVGERLSHRCGLGELVTHVCGDALHHNWRGQGFDAIVSWLAFYHIPRRHQLLRVCSEALLPQGSLFIEDLCCLEHPTDQQRQGLTTHLYAITLPLYAQYADGFERAGFRVESMENMTESWKNFTQARLAAYRQHRARHIRVHGREVVDGLEEFYSAVEHYFSIGLLGGVRLHARKL